MLERYLSILEATHKAVGYAEGRQTTLGKHSGYSNIADSLSEAVEKILSTEAAYFGCIDKESGRVLDIPNERISNGDGLLPIIINSAGKVGAPLLGSYYPMDYRWVGMDSALCGVVPVGGASTAPASLWLASIRHTVVGYTDSLPRSQSADTGKDVMLLDEIWEEWNYDFEHGAIEVADLPEAMISHKKQPSESPSHSLQVDPSRR